MTRLSLILPAYNEGPIIAASMRTVDDYLRSLCLSYELLIGDDGSTDGTSAAAEGAGVANARVVRRSHGGKGSILSACFLESRGEYAGFLDSDLEIPVECVGQLVHALDEGFDAAIASKNLSGADDRRPLRRRLITWAYNSSVRRLFGSRLSDHQAGAKMFRGDYIRCIMPSVTSQGWLWDTEVLAMLVRDRKLVREVPVQTRILRQSHVPGSQSAVQVIAAVYRLRRQMREKSRA